MAEYDNRNRGIIGRNDRKTSPNHPDITGTIDVDGVAHFIDGWKKDRKDGSGSFYSLSVKRKDKQGAAASGQSYGDAKAGGGRPSSRDLDDEIPFSKEWR